MGKLYKSNFIQFVNAFEIEAELNINLGFIAKCQRLSLKCKDYNRVVFL